MIIGYHSITLIIFEYTRFSKFCKLTKKGYYPEVNFSSIRKLRQDIKRFFYCIQVIMLTELNVVWCSLRYGVLQGRVS